ncbi:MAG: VWA domain-containing protein [Ignavibacteria bacterium]|nr:VWA domain-containing protein [Ignavibacteria bacterium]
MTFKLLTTCAVIVCAAAQAFSIGALFVRPLNSNVTYDAIAILTYDAKVAIQDHVATTMVDQTFYNELNAQVESTFIFPLPPGAIITSMAYWVNGVKVTASVRERADAQASYDNKIRVRIDPALLQEIGDNVFKMNIAPINAKSPVRFEITYTEILDYSLGVTSYKHFLKTNGLSPKPLERISLTIQVRSALELLDVSSPSFGQQPAHKIEFISPNEARVTFGDENYTPTKNYILNIVAKRLDVDMGTLTYVPVEEDSFGMEPFFLTWVVPPDKDVRPLPRSVVFVADVSSSMEGRRINQVREAMEQFLNELKPEDRFNIITFSTNVIGFRESFVDASTENIDLARVFIRSRTALGLTNISEAMHMALTQDYLPQTANVTIFLTDGEPSWGELNTSIILDSVRQWNTNSVRIYPVTVGEETSIGLMRDIAQISGGYLTEIANDEDIAIAVQDQLTRISMPNLNNPQITYGTLITKDVLPSVLPNVAVGGRLVQTGRYEVGGIYPVTLSGLMTGVAYSKTKDVLFGDPATNNKAVARLWANEKINELLDEIERVGEKKELVDAVIDLSIRFGILTKYTALYADPDDNPTGVPTDQRPVELTEITIAPMPATRQSIVTVTIDAKYAGQRLIISVVDLFGRELYVLFDGASAIGPIELKLFGDNDQPLALGTYFIVSRVADRQWTKSIIIVE